MTRCLQICTVLTAQLFAVAAAHDAAATIVNIDAVTSETATPATIFLAAGTYTVTPVGISGGGLYDGWNLWGNTSCASSSGCTQTVPTTVQGWKNSYDVVSDDITSVSVGGPPLVPVATEPTGVAQFQDYFIVSGAVTDRYHVDDQTVYPTAADALAVAATSTFTLSAPGLVGFAIRDAGFLGDNLGGMSLSVTLVPEPASAASVAVGLALLAARRRRPI